MRRDDYLGGTEPSGTAGDARYESADLPEEGELQQVATGDDALDEDLEAEEQRAAEGQERGIPDAAQPDTQGDEPLDAELGPEGEGDLAPEDL